MGRLQSWQASALIFLVAAGLALALVQLPRFGTDYSVFWSAARNAWGPVYDPGYMTGAQAWLHVPGIRPYAYPPTFLLLTLPFSALPFAWSFALWVGGQVAAFHAAGARLEPRFSLLLAISVISLRAAQPGQATLWVGACLFAALAVLVARPRLAGVLFGVALCIKPQVVILLPVALIAWREWRAFGWCLAAAATIVAASVAVLGFHKWTEWLASLQGFVALTHNTFGVVPLSPTWLLQGPTATITRLAFAALGVGLIFLHRHAGWPERLITVVGGSILCAPYALNYEGALMAPAAVTMVLSRSWRIVPGAALLVGLILNWWLLVAFMATSLLAPLIGRDVRQAKATGT